MKQWIAVHTFISEDTRREYCTPPEERDPPEENMTQKEWVDMVTSLPKAKSLQEWLGKEDFFFCHWEAETQDDILAQLEDLGLDKLMQTACYEMHRFSSAFRPLDEPRQFPPPD